MTDDHAVARDYNEYAKAKLSTAEYMRHAVKTSGRGGVELAVEYLRLHRGRGKLTFPEYVQYGVYDTTRYNADQQSRFLTNTLHWPITHVCCDMTWQATTEDKWLCAHILKGSGVPVPESLAVIDKSSRVYSGTRKIETADQLREFATSQSVGRFFGKENRGICSFGAFLAESADSRGVILNGRGHISYDQLMHQFVGNTPYLLQPVHVNHPVLCRVTPNLATVRVSVLIDNSDIKIPFCILKLPSSRNVADSFWRPGNLACHINSQTGQILSIRSKNELGTTEYVVHPETSNPLVGEMLPMWNRVLELVHHCAPIFQPIRYQSMDVAITPDGPLLIEINTGGGWDLLQLGSGQGFLTDEVCEFLRSRGYRKI